ncbi:MAG: hypothetical protein R3F59_18045 [Myxococcota bacterium]
MLLLFPLAALAQDPPADDEAAREAELFGEATEPEVPEPAPAEPRPAGSRDDAMLGGAAPDAEGDIARRLTLMDQRLTFGGRLWLQTVAAAPEGVDGPDQITLSSPNRLDLFADARPNDRVRAFASGRLQHDWTVRSTDTDLLGNLPRSPTRSCSTSSGSSSTPPTASVTAGCQRIHSWGAGRFGTPPTTSTSSARPAGRPRPAHRRRPAQGARPVRGRGRQRLTLSPTRRRPDARPDRRRPARRVGLRPDRAHRLGGPAQGPARALRRRPVVGHRPLRRPRGGLGLRTSAVPGPAVDETTAALLDLLPAADRPDGWAVQAVAGLDLTLNLGDDDALILGVEAFHNAFGTADVDTYPRMFLEGTYVPLYVGRDYGAAYVLLQGPGRWDAQTFLVSGIANLSDGSLSCARTGAGSR